MSTEHPFQWVLILSFLGAAIFFGVQFAEVYQKHSVLHAKYQAEIEFVNQKSQLRETIHQLKQVVLLTGTGINATAVEQLRKVESTLTNLSFDRERLHTVSQIKKKMSEFNLQSLALNERLQVLQQAYANNTDLRNISSEPTQGLALP